MSNQTAPKNDETPNCNNKKKLIAIVIALILVVALFNVVSTLTSTKLTPLVEQLDAQKQELADMKNRFTAVETKVAAVKKIADGIVDESAKHDQLLRAGYGLYKEQLHQLNAIVSQMGELLGDVPTVPPTDAEVEETAPVEVLAPGLPEDSIPDAVAPEELSVVEPVTPEEKPVVAEEPVVEVPSVQEPAPEERKTADVPAVEEKIEAPVEKVVPAETPAAEKQAPPKESTVSEVVEDVKKATETVVATGEKAVEAVITTAKDLISSKDEKPASADLCK